jgi:hypothetical protein
MGRERKEKVKKVKDKDGKAVGRKKGRRRKRRKRRNTSSKIADEEREHTEGQKRRPEEFSNKAGCKLTFTNTKTPSRIILLYLSHCESLCPHIVSVCNHATCHHTDNKSRLFSTALAAFTAKAYTGTQRHQTPSTHDNRARIYRCCEQQ